MSNTEVSASAKWATFPSFIERHVGPDFEELAAMLRQIGYNSLDSLVDDTIPDRLRFRKPLALQPAETEFEMLRKLREIAAKNRVTKSYIGLGYHACITPPVIQRHILENAGWYTAYTPYQAEIA
jgi:glycine cleavage system P protein (glycine dehydrogenase)